MIASLADPARRDAAAQELIALGDDAVPALISALQGEDANLVALCEQVLARIPSATPQLIQQLKTAHPIVRARAAETFYFSRDKVAIPALMEALRGEFFTVRARAAMALSNMGDARVIPHLLPLLKDREDEVRGYACMAIAKFNDPATFDEIANVLLDDPKIEVRQIAARSLGDTKHPAVMPYLMEALRDAFWWFEREKQVVDLLTAIEKQGSAAIDPMIEALADKEANVRRYAAMILGRLRDPRTMDELSMTMYDMHTEVGRAAAEALAGFGPQAVDFFLEALRHPEADIRENAINALAKIQDMRVGNLILEMLQDPERNIRKRALTLLGELRERRALPAIQEIAANRADREMSMLAKKILEELK